MVSTIINPLPIIVSLAIVLGVFAHDTQIDKALVAAVSRPATIMNENYNPIKLLVVDQHIHMDSGAINTSVYSGFGSQQPSTQPRTQDDKKYIAQKRLSGNFFGSVYHWPSI